MARHRAIGMYRSNHHAAYFPDAILHGTGRSFFTLTTNTGRFYSANFQGMYTIPAGLSTLAPRTRQMHCFFASSFRYSHVTVYLLLDAKKLRCSLVQRAEWANRTFLSRNVSL